MAEIGLFDAMYTERAVRLLKPDPVPDELINRVLDVGVGFPSGGNTQNWVFIVVREEVQPFDWQLFIGRRQTRSLRFTPRKDGRPTRPTPSING